MFNDDYKNIDDNLEEENKSSGFVIDLRKKLQEKSEPVKEEKIKLDFKPFWSGIFKFDYKKLFKKKEVKNKVSFKNIFKKPKKKQQYKIKNILLPIRRNLIWQKKLSQFSDVIDKLNIPKVKQVKRKEKEAEYVYKINWYRRALSFIVILILLVIPFKAMDYLQLIDLSSLEERVMVHSQAAIDNLLVAGDQVGQLNLDQAEIKFSTASDNFMAAQEELGQLQSWLFNLASLSSNPRLKLAAESKRVVSAGRAASELGKNFSLAIDSLIEEGQEDWIIKINNFKDYSSQALINLQDLRGNLNSINQESLPQEFQGQFVSWRENLNVLEKSLTSLIATADDIKEFLGYSYNRRYLLVFQNNTEARASGGFMGSYALVDFKKGKIDNIEIPAGGTYDTEAGMRSFIRSPRPLWLVNPRWFFWDANWWPDWPTTAENLMWFYEKSDGPTVDGVISFTPDVLESFLQITGPIYLQEYDLEISQENFWFVIQSTVERENIALSHPDLAEEFPESPENQPKKIIGDLAEVLLEILPEKIDSQSLLELITLLENDRQKKNILFYFQDDNLQEFATRWNLDGKMKESPHDYLMVVHTNIAGQKTDRKMEEKIFHDSQILSSGRIVNELTIVRKHEGIKNEAFTGARNVDWLRVYVPGGSQLIKASGFSTPDRRYFEYPESDWEIHPILSETEELAEIDYESGLHVYLENDKTVFANWVMTDPGEMSVIKIRYELPFRFKEAPRERNHLDFINHLLNINQVRPLVHSLLVQKQPGLKSADFFSRLRLADSWHVNWRYPEGIESDDAWLVNDKINSDKFWAILALPQEK